MDFPHNSISVCSADLLILSNKQNNHLKIHKISHERKENIMQQ